MDNETYVKVPSSRVRELCEQRLAKFDREADTRRQKYAAAYRATIRWRLKQLFRCKDITDQEACDRWMRINPFCWDLYDYRYDDITDILRAANQGTDEVLVSRSDLKLITK